MPTDASPPADPEGEAKSSASAESAASANDGAPAESSDPKGQEDPHEPAHTERRAEGAAERKSLVLCLDGTGNEYGHRNTNVVLLNRVLERSDKQLVYYDPGVGTSSLKPTLTSLARYWQRAIGLAFGYGLEQNVVEAYRFLMANVEPGDTVYLIGFSRGAYTARVVAALLHGVGLLPKGHDHLIPFALRCLRVRGFDGDRLRGFQKQFSRHVRKPLPPGAAGEAPLELLQPKIVLGLWDTVSSVSWAFDEVEYRYTTRNPSVEVARHAVSIDERRAFFRTNMLVGAEGQDLKQVWFAGVHSDVGGGYPIHESGLSKLALEWMAVELSQVGGGAGDLSPLAIDEEAMEGLLYDVEGPPVVSVLSERGAGAAKVLPSERGHRHRSLKGPWWACELWPKRPWDPRRRTTTLRLNLGQERWVKPGACLHESVLRRREATDYRPKNLASLTEVAVEPRVRFPASAERLAAADNARTLLQQEWKAGAKQGSDPEARGASARGPDVLVAVLSVYALLAVFFAPLIFLGELPGAAETSLLSPLVWPAWVAGWLTTRPGVFFGPLWLLLVFVGAGLFERSAPLKEVRRSLEGRQGQTRLRQEDIALPHLWPVWRSARAQRVLARLREAPARDGASTPLQEYQRHLILDCLFAPLYAVAFCALAWIAHAPAWPLVLMALALVADLLENALLWAGLASKRARLLQAAALPTLIKGVAIALAVAGLVATTLCPELLDQLLSSARLHATSLWAQARGLVSTA